MPAARLAAVAPTRQVGSRQDGVARAWIHIGVGTDGEGVAVGTDDLREGGIVRRQPVGMRLREGPISQRVRVGERRRIGCVHLVMRGSSIGPGPQKAGPG